MAARGYDVLNVGVTTTLARQVREQGMGVAYSQMFVAQVWGSFWGGWGIVVVGFGSVVLRFGTALCGLLEVLKVGR